MEEAALLYYVSVGMIVSGAATFIGLATGTAAPYGRYTEKASSIFGFLVPGKLAWILQECPCVFVTLYCIYTGILIPVLIKFNTSIASKPYLSIFVGE